MANKTLSILLLLIALFSTPTFAFNMESLYKSDKPISTHSRYDRYHAVLNAFKQVLVKVSGNANIATLPKFNTLIKQAPNFVESYRYYYKKPKKEDENNQLPISVEQRGQLMLEISFDSKDVNELLKKEGQAVWERDRPLMLVLMAINDGDKPYVLNAVTTNEITQIIQQNADDRGLPVVMPIMDLVDLSNISVDDVTQVNLEKLKKILKRYHSNVILLGTINHEKVKNDKDNKDDWNGKFELYVGSEHLDWVLKKDSLNSLINVVINDVADQLASRYAILAKPASEDDHILVTVTNVKHFEDFSDITNYLRQLSAISQLEVIKISSGEITYDIKLASSIDSLMQAVSLNDRLQISDNKTEETDTLVYRWL